MKWGRLINASLKLGLEPEEALLAVLRAARMIEEQGIESLFTRSELRALDALAECGTYQAAAAVIGCSQSTVHGYVKRAASKLQVPARAAVAEARRRGLLQEAAA